MPAVPSNVTQGMPCDAELCHGHGRCFVLHEKINCECRLGYIGEFCHNRVSKSISTQLTLGVLGCIIGVVVLAFLLAFLKKKATVYKRKATAASKKATMEKSSEGPL